jgi:hypothetical protein
LIFSIDPVIFIAYFEKYECNFGNTICYVNNFLRNFMSLRCWICLEWKGDCIPKTNAVYERKILRLHIF